MVFVPFIDLFTRTVTGTLQPFNRIQVNIVCANLKLTSAKSVFRIASESIDSDEETKQWTCKRDIQKTFARKERGEGMNVGVTCGVKMAKVCDLYLTRDKLKWSNDSYILREAK